MPELPEVETVCRGLRSLLVGNTFKHVKKFRPNLRIPFPENFEALLEGRSIKKIERRAKYIQIFLDSKQVLLIHLGMSGRLLMQDNKQFNQEAPHTHDHVIFHLSSGDWVRYRDPRRFGLMDLCHEDVLTSHRLFRHLGPEPLESLFDAERLSRALKGKKTSIKVALLDQRLVVGIGNIYVNEALFRSGISPLRNAGSLSRVEVATLLPILKEILEEAISAGGSTLRDHIQPNGKLGYFQYKFKIYGRENKACLNCGNAHLVKRIVQVGRSTFYCLNCQV
ncbi:MAG: bifunctional DNA-formamidopyrimidine glycosylase/DNA-(apurinic or apyrimidinic site) lyase [Alphaproteobacteria bacterium]|nr:bifunctional DNA-formamidopyrimidine glycosylase/DNA-(apurinic or apyrimidinic site) lyase [Alphaproteobacteria bacterium]